MGRNRKQSDEHGPSVSTEDNELETVDTRLPMDVVRLEWTGGMSVRSLEARAGFTPGRLSGWLRPARRGIYPTVYGLQSFAEAYHAPLAVISRAFAAEAGIPELHAGDPRPAGPPEYTPEEQQLVEDFRRTREPVRSLLAATVRMAAEREDRREGTA